MQFRKVLKSDQEQAVASWINYLNQVRLDRLMETLNTQNINLESALKTINTTMSVIDKDIIERNRGAVKGMHGFIAEIAECGVGNARRQVEGKLPNYIWINDNGPADLLRDGVQIQQKFSESGGHLSLQAVKQHMKAYPWFLQGGSKYQIPQDHYDKIRYYMSIPKEQANKMPTSNGEFSLKQWKEVHDFFTSGDITLDDIEPSKLKYNDVQKNQIHQTLQNEKKSLKDTDQQIRKQAYEESKPTLQQGLQTAGISAAIEGGTTFVSVIVKKRQSGKKIKDFTEEDWKDVFAETGLGTVKGGIRGISIYALTNYTATPASVANALCTASFGIAQQAYLFRQGSITEEQFIINAEVLCLDTSVSALSSFIGQAIIPVPVLGAVIGNTVGTLLYQIAKDTLSKKEQKLLAQYLKELEELDKHLERQYRQYIDQLNKNLSQYYSLLNRAFSPDYNMALEGSAKLAIWLGVPESETVQNLYDVDRYFMS